MPIKKGQPGSYATEYSGRYYFYLPFISRSVVLETNNMIIRKELNAVPLFFRVEHNLRLYIRTLMSVDLNRSGFSSLCAPRQ